MADSDRYDFFEEPPLHVPGPETKKVLVIDDITYVVRSISRILRSQGYYVITAMTGKEALSKFEKYRPDLLTVDQKLPDMSGLQLVEKIRKLFGGERVKVIFISAVQEKEEIRAILNSGIDNYLLKPFKKEILLTAVRKLIG
ncbi:MAG: response regulator [Spirochaetales bacterium]|nr:response regulator [Spirochaetales bacterium]